MNTTIKYCLISIFLFGPYLTNIRSQENLFGEADSLYAEGRYFEASIAYEQYIFEHPSDPLYNLAKLQKGLCYKADGQYEKALKELSEISQMRLDKGLLSKVLYEKSINSFLLQRYSESLLNLSRIPPHKQNPEIHSDILSLKILTLHNLRRFDEAREAYVQLIDISYLREAQKKRALHSLDSLYHKKSLPPHLRENRARNLSQFIPGAGQVYAGHPVEGAVSFLLNAALLGFGIHQLYFQYYFTAYIGGFATFYKTYAGGMRRAAYLAKTESENNMKEFNRRCIEMLQEMRPNGLSSPERAK